MNKGIEMPKDEMFVTRHECNLVTKPLSEQLDRVESKVGTVIILLIGTLLSFTGGMLYLFASTLTQVTKVASN